MAFRKMTELDLDNRRLLIRQDLNVPLENGRVSNDARLRAAVPTLRQAMGANARTLVVSHLGRPVEGEYDDALSLAPVAAYLSELLGVEVPLAKGWIDGVEVGKGQVVLGENVRFLKGEGKDDPALAQRMAGLCDVFVMDAFGTAHRAQASTHGVGRHAPIACAGPLMAAELEALELALAQPRRPLVAIIGGSKVSTKVAVLETLLERVDQLIVGGGIANTFLAAAGSPIGHSLHEADFIPEAQRLLAKAKAKGAAVPLPTDVVCAASLDAGAEGNIKAVEAVTAEDMILDIGPASVAHLQTRLATAGTIVWNGPLGVFEHDAFSAGTRAIAQAVAASRAYSLAGGGDTIAAIEKFGVQEGLSYISTGGGALMEYLEGKTLPAVAMLQARASA